jgi:ElaB/YqjD/DUF883 family membrane-anchored ribosome-binding protein
MSTKSHSHTKNSSEVADMADIAGEAGNRLKAIFDNSREFVAGARDKVVASAKATDKAVQENPYKTIAVAAGVGLLFGFFMARRHASGKSDSKE